MSSDQNRSGLRVPHDRRSIRLAGYDYAQRGAYFVTICTTQHRHLFGEITAGRSHLNAFGHLVKQCWLAIPRHFPHAELDVFVIMPDHVHGIIGIVDDGATASGDGKTDVVDWVGARHVDVVGARHALPLQKPPRSASDPTTRTFGHPPPRALSAIVGSFKSAAARAINADRGRPGTPVWQRNYFEHIIRTEHARRSIRHYIRTNPARWGTSLPGMPCPLDPQRRPDGTG